MKRLLILTLAAALMTVGVRAAPAETMDLSAAGAVLMEKSTGTVLYEAGAHEKREPASVTKIMTLLLIMEALDSGRLSSDELVTVSAQAAGMGGSQVYLKEGEQFSVDTLLKCVAVVSGNDAAVALAEHLSGSETAFVQRMNERAQQLGMTDTTFCNCTGLPAQGHVTSAYDIALMSRELILNHPSIRAYTTVWMDSIRDGTFGLTNTNRLIRFYSGATGLKTGSTSSAGCCISATAERDGMELIAVVLGCPTSAQRFADAQTLLDYGFANYARVPVCPESPLPPVDVRLGTVQQVQPVLSRDCILLLEKGQEGSVTTQIDLPADVEAPVEDGQTLGTFTVYLDGAVQDEIPLLASEPVDRLTLPDVFVHLLNRLFPGNG